MGACEGMNEKVARVHARTKTGNSLASRVLLSHAVNNSDRTLIKLAKSRITRRVPGSRSALSLHPGNRAESSREDRAILARPRRVQATAIWSLPPPTPLPRPGGFRASREALSQTGPQAPTPQQGPHSQAVHDRAPVPTLRLPLVHLGQQVQEGLLGVRRVPVGGPAQELKVSHQQVPFLQLGARATKPGV